MRGFVKWDWDLEPIPRICENYHCELQFEAKILVGLKTNHFLYDGDDFYKFHSDFDDDDKDYSNHFTVYGKKCYIDLVNFSDRREKYHIRCKGVNSDIIEEYAKIESITPMELYESLYEGGKITFDLASVLHCLEIDNNITISKCENFTREIKQLILIDSLGDIKN